MNVDDLWIGDSVWIRSKGRNGIWEGKTKAGKGKVRVDHQQLVVDLADLGIARDEPPQDSVEVKTPTFKESLPSFSSKELDLHIGHLNPDLEFQTPQQIVLYQIRKCKEFVSFAISRRWVTVLIIHGKGTGALKEEVYHLLEDFGEVYHKIPRNNGGAVEVWFQY